MKNILEFCLEVGTGAKDRQVQIYRQGIDNAQEERVLNIGAPAVKNALSELCNAGEVTPFVEHLLGRAQGKLEKLNSLEAELSVVMALADWQIEEKEGYGYLLSLIEKAVAQARSCRQEG